MQAHSKGKESILPRKIVKKDKKEEEYTVFLLQYQDLFALRKRENGLLKNLWEFPNREGILSKKEIQELFSPVLVEEGINNTHIFTHKKWNMHSYTVQVREKLEGYAWVSLKDMEKEYALPTAFKPFFGYLKKKYPQ